MVDTLTNIKGVPALVAGPEGKKLSGEQDALDLIGEAISGAAELVVVTVERLEDAFFELKTGLAGHIVQKIVNYRRRLVILGDISQHIAASRSLRDFVNEANRGTQIWFMKDMQELEERLGTLKSQA